MSTRMARKLGQGGAMRIGGALLGRHTVPNFVDVTVTNAQMLALRATPKVLLPIPNITYVYREFCGAILVVNVTTTAYTVGTNDMVVRQTGTTGVILSDTIEAVGFLDQVAIKGSAARPKVDPIGFLLNKSLVLHNSGASEFTGGNAANTLTVRCFYRDHNLAGLGTLA